VSTGAGFVFGPYRLDVRTKQLLHHGRPLSVSEREFLVFEALVRRAGEVVSKDELVDVGWRGDAASDNSIAHVITRIRRVLDDGGFHRCLKNQHGRGYVFEAPVQPVDAPRDDVDIDALIGPYRALRSGRAAIETLERSSIEKARATFERLLAQNDGDAGAHVGMANACVFQYESTRADAAPDVEALRLAASHARRACLLNPNVAEAFATLGFVLERTGDHLDALAALRRAVSLDPHDPHHQLRLAFVAWGKERLMAARYVLDEVRDCAPARFLAATVYVARDELDKAEREIDAGLTQARNVSSASGEFSVVGLNWLKGLLCLARGAGDGAMTFLQAELALEPIGHLYGREIAASAWHAIGALRLRHGEKTGAREAFEQSIARAPGHAMAHAGLALLSSSGGGAPPTPSNAVDAAMAGAVALVATEDVTGAARLVEAALRSAPEGNAGWLVPIEPLLEVYEKREAWVSVLAVLRVRATNVLGQ
jgi:DNA-binding winged helix-turn-helix (wHTH) protein/Tfp pilus assembly protein PilF